MPLVAAPLTAASAAIVPDPITYSADDAALELAPIGTFESGFFDESGAEIVVPHGDRLFVVNAQAGSVDVLDYSDPATSRRSSRSAPTASRTPSPCAPTGSA